MVSHLALDSGERKGHSEEMRKSESLFYKRLYRMKQRKKFRRRLLPLVLLLCLAVYSGTALWLKSIGLAMETTDMETNDINVIISNLDDANVGQPVRETIQQSFFLPQNAEGENDIDSLNADLSNDTELDGESEAGRDAEKARNQDDTDSAACDTNGKSENESDESVIQQKFVSSSDISYAELLSLTRTSPAGIVVTVQMSKGAFPEGTDLLVEDVPAEDAIRTARENASEESNVLDAVAVDISFVNDEGVKLEPDEGSQVLVQISLPEDKRLTGEEFVLLHKKEDGSVETVEEASLKEDGAAFSADSFSIYVISSLGTHEKDHINETSIYVDPWGETNSDGYVKNSSSAPYLIYLGDTISVFTDQGSTPEYAFWLSWDDNNDDHKPVQRTAAHPYNFNNGDGLASAEYVAVRTGDFVIHLNHNETEVDTFYGRVATQDKTLDHSDIEVLDGGFYRLVRVATNTMGNSYVTTLTYDAHVSVVNHCYIYDADNSLVKQYDSDAYWHTGELGSPQYEYTSKNNGTPSFLMSKTQHARFDVQMKYFLRDVSITKISGGTTTVIDYKTAAQLPDDKYEKVLTRDNVIYDLGRQDVIDANNKCPDHSGLDFTVKAEITEYVDIPPARLTLQGTKLLNGGTLTSGMFSFELRDAEDHLVATVTNDGTGLVRFPELEFITDGTYHYRISEVIPATPGAFEYDSKVIDVEIEVTEEKDGNLKVQLKEPSAGTFTFTNTALYQLPETGGSGTGWYVTGGEMLMGVALLCLLRRRRRC